MTRFIAVLLIGAVLVLLWALWTTVAGVSQRPDPHARIDEATWQTMQQLHQVTEQATSALMQAVVAQQWRDRNGR